METIKVNNKDDIFFFLKMSIFQFLLKSKFSFYNKDKEIIFDLLANDKKTNLQNNISISEDNCLFITSLVGIKKEFLSTEKLIIFANYVNEFFSGVLSCYVKGVPNDDYSLFYIEVKIVLKTGTCIDEDFWKTQLTIHINNVSMITDFLFYDFSDSGFFLDKGIESQNFKRFFFCKMKGYIEALKILQEQEQKRKENFEGWTEDQLNKEIDKELEKFSRGKNKEEIKVKLNILVQALNKLKKKDI